MISNIPFDLQQLNQWVVSGNNKLPLNPRTGAAADPTDPSTWGTFSEVQNCGYPNVGFVLSRTDPFCVIDLDNPFRRPKDKSLIVEGDADHAHAASLLERQARILAQFQSYAEVSQSGEGLHIIVRGKIPQGVRRDCVEVYPHDRYIICTGNRYNDLPIAERQDLLDALYLEMQPAARVELAQVDSHTTDEAVLKVAEGAANGAKFAQLWRGDLSGYPSQSEADFALMAILAFYSKDNAQCKRMFLASALGQRPKAHRRGYCENMLAQMRAKELPQIDFSVLLNQINQPKLNGNHDRSRETDSRNKSGNSSVPFEAVEDKGKVDAIGSYERQRDIELQSGIRKPSGVESSNSRTRSATRGTLFPPGFVGECAEYFYASSIRPVREIALATAIGLTAGVVGRAFNISNTGLNHYVIVLARTGSGKDGVARSIDRLIGSARQTVPMADQFIGPGVFASGQALIRVLDSQPCFVSVLGEVGLTLQQICSPNAHSSQVALKRVLLDLYTKSGFSATLRPSVYSDKEKNTQMVQAPNLTIIGESTQENFFENLDSGHIAEGLIPRFTVFEYDGPRPKRNRNADTPPPPELLNRFTELLNIALTSAQQRSFRPVSIAADAQTMLDDFDEYVDGEINATIADVSKQLWNRAHLKALKLGALVAVGVNAYEPVVTQEIADWSIATVCADIRRMLEKFEGGEVGGGNQRQEGDIRRCITAWFQLSNESKRQYKAPESMLSSPTIPFSYIRRRCQLLTSFKNDRRGSEASIISTINALISIEALVKMPDLEAFKAFGVRQPVYARGPGW